jgi:hypothetical protein
LPAAGEKVGVGVVGRTVNEVPVLATPLTVTTTLPVVAPVGTAATIDVALQLVIVAVVPLNFTVLVPCVAPKFVPAIVTVAPIAPEVGVRLLIVGVAALPTTGAQTNVRKKRVWNRNEATRVVRFIGKPFLCRQRVGTQFLRPAASTHRL